MSGASCVPPQNAPAIDGLGLAAIRARVVDAAAL